MSQYNSKHKRKYRACPNCEEIECVHHILNTWECNVCETIWEEETKQ